LVNLFELYDDAKTCQRQIGTVKFHVVQFQENLSV